MRTYSRKRPEYQAIEGVENLCRLCLGQAEAAVPIFTEGADSVCALPLRIMICVGLEMAREDCLPNTICKECYKELDRYYTFRKKCEVTYQKLKSHVLAVKEREYCKALKIESQELEVGEETVVEPQQHLLLTINDDQQVELVNVANLDRVQLDSLQDLNNVEKVKIPPNEESNEVQMQDITTTNPSLSTLEIQTTSDLSLIMSTMLIELGVMRQQENGLVLVDENLRTVELEGDDNTKIVLRLMEEDEDENEAPDVERQDFPLYPSLMKKPEDDILPIPQKPITLNGKDSGDKNKESSTTCGACGKRFASRSVLARHRRVHSGERPHACAHCGRRFAQRAVMQRHELVHRETRPFKCSSCPKSFTQRGALAAHARRHQPHAPLALHRCERCDKVFLYASGLSRHAAAHSGRVFACGACARLFRDQSSLRRHARTAHRPPRPAAD